MCFFIQTTRVFRRTANLHFGIYDTLEEAIDEQASAQQSIEAYVLANPKLTKDQLAEWWKEKKRGVLSQ